MKPEYRIKERRSAFFTWYMVQRKYHFLGFIPFWHTLDESTDQTWARYYIRDLIAGEVCFDKNGDLVK